MRGRMGNNILEEKVKGMFDSVYILQVQHAVLYMHRLPVMSSFNMENAT